MLRHLAGLVHDKDSQVYVSALHRLHRLHRLLALLDLLDLLDLL